MGVDLGGSITFDLVEKGAKHARLVTGLTSAMTSPGVTAAWVLAALIKAANEVVVPGRS